jgi:sensor histidine kinase YesM
MFAQVRPFLPGVDELGLAEMLAGGTIGEMIAFGSVAGVLHAAEFHQRFREREALSLQLQARLSDAQLRALRAQLNPHFLFNTLNAATALLHRDPDAADAMLTRLGELLRLTLRAAPDHETPLREEIEFLDRYVAIMRIRFADRVTIRSDVDAGVSEALVPSFILQPIVENAFEHGVGRLQRPGSIDISAHASGDALVLRVRDDGPGPAEASRGLGVGLTNTRQRLAELYGTAAGLTLSARAGGGTVVEVRLPLRREDQAA